MRTTSRALFQPDPVFEPRHRNAVAASALASESSATVVFLHGILSSGETCWRNENGAFWPKLLSQLEEVREVGIYVVSYETGLFSGTYSVSDVVDALDAQFELDEVSDSKILVLVCHSIGGIVGRDMLSIAH